MVVVLLPAYGRTYETIEAAEKDWDAGKDFRILGGPYCSIRDKALLNDMGHDVALIVGNVTKIIYKGDQNG